MKKLNFNGVEEIAEFTPAKKLVAGGYVVKIVKVEDVPEKSYLRFYYDIAEGDYKGFFNDAYKADNRPTKKWGGTFIKSYSDNSLKFFKSFVTAVENSNKGFKWDEEHEQQFVNKLVGMTMREEEYLSQKGDVRVAVKPDFFHSADKIRNGEYTVRAIKKLDNVPAQTSNVAFVNPFANDVPAFETNASAVDVAVDNAPWESDSDFNPFA